jgi:hypothetical protein
MSLAGYDYYWRTSAGGLAALLRLKRDELPRTYMATLVIPQHLNFDDAGSHDQAEAVAFGGWLYTFDRWIELESAWNRALKDEGVEIFHATDLDNGYGEFEGWTRDRKNALMVRLTSIAATFTDYGIGCGIVKADYDSLFPDWLQTDFRHPLNFCLYGTMSMLIRQEQLGKLKVGDRPLRVMIEQKPGYEGFIAEIYYRFRNNIAPELLGQLTWGTKKDVPLQAADLIAHEISKFVGNQRYRPHLPLRKSLEALGTRRQLLITTPDAERIAGFRQFVEQVRDGTFKLPETN